MLTLDRGVLLGAYGFHERLLLLRGVAQAPLPVGLHDQFIHIRHSKRIYDRYEGVAAIRYERCFGPRLRRRAPERVPANGLTPTTPGQRRGDEFRTLTVELVLWLRQTNSNDEAAPWEDLIVDPKAKERLFQSLR